MESLAVDHSTAIRMIKFLNGELKAAQETIAKLQEENGALASPSRAASCSKDISMSLENEQLKQELATMKFKLEAALEGQDTKSIPDMSRYDQVCTRLLEVEQEKHDMVQTHGRALQALQQKLEETREKYHKAKQSKLEYKQSVVDMQAQLTEALHAPKIVQPEEGPTPDSSGTSQNTVCEKREEQTAFDPIAFLSTGEICVPEDSKLPYAPFSTPFPGDRIKKLKGLSKTRAIVQFSGRELTFPKRRHDRFIAVIPEYVLGVTAEGPVWRQHDVVRELSKGDSHAEVVWKRDHSYYCGRFQCVGRDTLTAKEIRDVWQYKDDLVSRAMLEPKLVPPMMSDLVRKMSRDGMLRIICLQFVYAGYSEDICRVLHPEIFMQKNTAAAAKGRNGKKKHRGQQNASEGVPPNKRAKFI